MTPIALCIPMVNPNEREAVLVELFVKEKQLVRSGDLIATLETTKSTLDILAEHSGYVLGLTRQKGEHVIAGETLCYLGEKPDEPIPFQQSTSNAPANKPDGLRITQPALAYAQENNLDLSSFHSEQLVTLSMVKAMQFRQSGELNVKENSVVIYGGGGHGKTVIELIRAQGQLELLGVIDDGLAVGSRVLELPVLGGSSSLGSLRAAGVSKATNAVGGIGNLSGRLRVFESIKLAGFAIPTIIHPRAVIEPSAQIAEGCQIFALAYIGSSSIVDFGCIVNTGVVISHDCVIGDYCNISPGAILAGGVVVDQRVLIGMGVTVNLNIKIGADARIGNGATIKADVPEGGIVKAGSIWPG